mgnify:CR=1 FL=1
MDIQKVRQMAFQLLQNPRYFGPGVNGSLNNFIHTRGGSREFNPAGVNVFEEDWDNLIILDACRYDEFADHTHLLPDGDLQKRMSRGSHSREWVKGNFGQRLHDVAYLSTNLFYSRLKENGHLEEGEVHEFLAVQEEEGWENHGKYGPTPEKTTRQAKRLADEYQDKRFVVHYMQPHCPYLGKVGRKRFNPDDTPRVVCRSDRPEATPEVLRTAYQENLQLVLELVMELLPELNGKTVISADHGELLGDRSAPIPVKDWGHPEGVYVPELTEVPWYVIESEDRKRIVSEPPDGSDGADELKPDYVKDQLEQLGYV